MPVCPYDGPDYDHRRLRAEIRRVDAQPRPMSMSLLEKCSLLDDMPLAFCIIELVFNEDGHGVDFIFRYCNAEMATIEGVPVEEMLGRSFYEVFPNGDKKWLVSYADVALNGTKHILHDYSPEVDEYLTIHCYQVLCLRIAGSRSVTVLLPAAVYNPSCAVLAGLSGHLRRL